MRNVPLPPLAPELRERLVFRHGAAVGAWLDALPATAEALARRWELAFDGEVASGLNSVVLPCRHADGRASVLKLSPEPATLALQTDALAVWQASAGDEPAPVPAVWERDDAAGAVLMEAIEPGTTLAQHAEPPALDAVARLLRALHRPPAPAPADLIAPGPLVEARSRAARAEWPRLGARFGFVFGLWERRREQSPRAQELVPAGALERGAERALALAADRVARPVLIHGDLHASNVLDGGPRRGLVAIDPNPVVGDAAFDALDWVLWRAADRAEVERRIAVLAPVAGGSEERLRAWCQAFAAMAAVSLAVRDDGEDDQLALLRELAV